MTTAKPTKTTVLLRRRLLCRAARKDMAKMGRCWSGGVPVAAEMSADAPADAAAPAKKQDRNCRIMITTSTRWTTIRASLRPQAQDER